MREPTAARPQLRALTGLRFFAALQVLVFHVSGWASWTQHEALRNIAGSGFVAVSLFFVLSGFILTYAHAAPGSRSVASGGDLSLSLASVGELSLDARAFYANRFARIYPAYAFALALIAPLFAGHTIRVEGVARFVEATLAVPLLLQAWVPALAMEWNPPAWSLSAEVFFYALFPLVVSRLFACRRSTAWSIALASYGFSVAFALAYVRLAPDGPDQGFQSTAFWLDVVRYNPAVRLPEFIIGIVVGRWYVETRPERVPTAVALLGTLLALGVTLVTLGLSSSIPYPVLHNGLLAPAFALLIVSLAVGRGFVANLLGTRPLVALGDASYSLYILHVPLLILWHKAFLHLPGLKVDSVAARSAFFAFTIVASLACYRYVEVPLRRVILGVWRRAKGAQTVRN